MFYAFAARFDVTVNVKKFLNVRWAYVVNEVTGQIELCSCLFLSSVIMDDRFMYIPHY